MQPTSASKVIIQPSTIQSSAYEDERVSLFNAVLAGDEPSVSALLGKTPELIHEKTKTGGNSLLHIAARHGHESICLLLLEKGHKTNPVNERGRTPYQGAKSDEIRQLLLDKAVEIRQLLFDKAVLAGDEPSVRAMLDETPKLIRTKIGGNSLLHTAVVNEHEPICRLLLEKGHITNPVNDAGKTPYQCATSVGIKQLLLDHHKIALSDEYCTASKISIELQVKSRDAFQLGNDHGQIIFACSWLGYRNSEQDPEIRPYIEIIFREDILMTPYYGELLVIHEDTQAIQLTNMHNRFVKNSTPYEERVKIITSTQNFREAQAYLTFVGQGLKLFPFLREFPKEDDRPDIAEAKKMFLVFGVNELIGYFKSCTEEDKHTLGELPHFGPVIEYATRVLPKGSGDPKAAIWSEMSREMYVKYNSAPRAKDNDPPQ